MRVFRLVLLSAALVAGLLSSGFFQLKPPEARIENFGILTFESERIVLNDNSVTGTDAFLDGVRWVKKTNEIPAEAGTRFGIEYVIHGTPHQAIEVVEIITYPGTGLTNPETGKTLKVSICPKTVFANEPTLMGYGLDTAWEAKPGEWTFQVEQNDQIVLEKRFQVM